MMSLTRTRRRRASATRPSARHAASVLLESLESRQLLAGGPLQVTITEVQTSQSVMITDNGAGDANPAVGVINYCTPAVSPFTDFVIKNLTVYSNRTTATTMAILTQSGIVSRSTSTGGNATLEITATDPDFTSPSDPIEMTSSVSGTFTNAAANQDTTAFQSLSDETGSPTGTLTSTGIAPDSHNDTAAPTALSQSAPFTPSNITTITLGPNGLKTITDQYTGTTTIIGTAAAPDVTTTKTADAASITAGQTPAGYTVTITNSGHGNANDVVLNDPLPPGAGNDLTWSIDTTVGNPSSFMISGTPPGGFNGTPGTQVLTFNPSTGITLGPGQSLTVHVVTTTNTTNSDTGTSVNPLLNPILGQYAVLMGPGANFASNQAMGGNVGIISGGAVTMNTGVISGRLDFEAATGNPGNGALGGVFFNVTQLGQALTDYTTLSSGLKALSTGQTAAPNPSGGFTLDLSNQAALPAGVSLQTFNGNDVFVFTVSPPTGSSNFDINSGTIIDPWGFRSSGTSLTRTAAATSA
jgi:uncharacterized repeat protein (TIGR01451 family)